MFRASFRLQQSQSTEPTGSLSSTNTNYKVEGKEERSGLTLESIGNWLEWYKIFVSKPNICLII